jgi:hypothetical protein
VIIALAAPGVLLAADDWRGWPTGDRMTLAVGGYAADVDTKVTASKRSGLAGTPLNFADDPGFYSSATALLESLNWLFDANVDYMDTGMEIRGGDTDATVFLGDAGVRWKPFRNVGFGLSYAMLNLDGEYSNDSIDTDIDLDSVGPRLSLNIAF